VKIEAGVVVGGRYQLERLLGEGGMGAVWAATHTVTKKAVALKFLHADRAADATIRQRFLREARAACAVRHPNVVAVHDVFETEDGAPLMVMDLLVGETLASKLARDGALPLADVVRFMAPVVSAVGTAHGLGIVHRDLKPENIFLAQREDGSGQIEMKVLDFGIAKLTSYEGLAANTSALTADGGMLGTPYYMSPEQVDGERDVDVRSDIWSLGVILYQCLSGVLPTEGENLGQVFKIITRGTIPPLAERANVPPEVANLVERMITRDRAIRPQTLVEVAEVLARATGAAPTMPRLRDSMLRISVSPVSALAHSLGEAATVSVETAHGVAHTLAAQPRSNRLAVLGGVGAVVLAIGAGTAWWARSHGAIEGPPAPPPATAAAVSASPPLPPPSVGATNLPVSVGSSVPPAMDAPAPPIAPGSAPPIAHPPKPHTGHTGNPAAPASGTLAPAPTPATDRPGGVYDKAPF
jgi:serine/threonine protein kinase